MKRKLLALFLVIVCLVGLIPIPVMAESVKTHKITIGIGQVKGQEKRYVYPDQVKENATYTYKSSNKSVVKVNKNSGAVTGVKGGSATITITRKLNGKSKVVDQWKVKVVATASKIGKQDGMTYGKNHKIEVSITQILKNINSKASYQVTSSNSSVVKVSGKAKKSNDFTIKLVTKDTGISILTISQVTKKKTIKIGKVIVSVKDVQVSDSNSYLLVADQQPVDMKFDYTDGNKYYRVRSLDSSILSVLGDVDEDGCVKVRACSPGMVTLYFYEGSKIIAKKTVVVEDRESGNYAVYPSNIAVT